MLTIGKRKLTTKIGLIRELAFILVVHSHYLLILFFRKTFDIRCMPSIFSKKQLWQKCGYYVNYLFVE